MYDRFQEHLAEQLGEIEAAGLFKHERLITTPQGAHVGVSEQEVLNLSANNYLGLAQHPAVNAAGARFKLITSDGVFSMDGYIARLDEICDLADRYGALVHFDDCHATGFVGSGGRGTHELRGCMDRVDIITGTLGKALGGASGGYTAAQ